MARNLKLQVILDAIDRATGPFKQITQGSKGAAAAIRDTRDHLRSLEAAQKDLKGFANLKRSSEATAAALDEQQRKVRELTHQINNAEGSTKQLTRQRQQAIKQAQKLSTRYDKEQSQLQVLRDRMKNVHGMTGSLSDRQRQLSQEIDAANKRLDAQRAALDQLNKAKVGEKFNEMRSSVGRFARQAVVTTTLVGGGMFALANSTATLGDQTAKTADMLGVEIEALQELRYAGEQAGIASNTFDVALRRMIRRTSEAAQGGGPAANAIRELGLSAHELADMRPEEALEAIADSMTLVENQGDRLRLAFAFFDTDGAAMVNMLKAGSAGLEEYRRQARLTGYVLSEQAARDAEVFKTRLQDAQLTLAGLKNIIGAELMPVVSDLMAEFSEWMVENRERVEAFAKTFAQRFREAIPTIINIARGLASTASAIASVTGFVASLVGGFDNLGMAFAFFWALKPIISILAFGKALFVGTKAVIGLATTLPLLSTGFAAVLGGLKSLSLFLLTNPIGWAIAAIAGAAFLVIKFWDPIKGFFKNIWAEVREGFAGGIGGITKMLINWSPLGVLYRIFAGVLRWFGFDLPSKFTEFGGNLISGLVKGIFGGLKAAKDAVLRAGGAVIGWFKGKLGINSPSKVFAAFGANTMEGYQQGIEKAQDGPLKQIGTVAKNVARAGAGIALGGAMAASAAALPRIGVDLPNIGSIPIESRGPLPSSSTGGIVIQGGINITVNAAPGMDERALAEYVGREVQRALAEAAARDAARRRSAFHDID